MSSRILENVPRVAQFIGRESYLTPFIGSLYAALAGMGKPRPYAELLALSGAGNRLSWRPNDWYGGNCDILACEEPPFAPHLRVLKAVGLKATIRLLREITGLAGPCDPPELSREEIISSIDRGFPVIAMGIIGPPECCVVYGYEKSGEALIGWNYFQDSEGFPPDQPFKKEGWLKGLYGYLLLEDAGPCPTLRESALAAFRAIVRHARQYEMRGSRMGLAAWAEMLRQLERDDFTQLKGLLLPDSPELWGEEVWSTTAQGRFFVYCDALCQIHERGVACRYYDTLKDACPEWAPCLIPAIAAWKECAAYGGFLWKYLTMDPAGYEKFKDPALRKILADEGLKCMEKDAEAIGHIEALLEKCGIPAEQAGD